MREFGSEHPSLILPDGYLEGFEKYGHCTWLRSGREALFLIALNLKGDKEHPDILMPAYCCHSMSEPFIKAGWDIIYYRLNPDLTADIEYLEQILREKKPSAVLTMNFLGSAPTVDAISCVKRLAPECICIEDFSQCTFALEAIWNPLLDYYMSSIRKSVGTCDGAVIISHQPLDETSVEEGLSDFVTERLVCQQMKAKYEYTRDSAQKDVFFAGLKEQETELDNFTGVHRISDTGMKMIKSVNGEMVRFCRQTNMKHITRLLYGKVESIPGIERSFDVAPFAFPIMVDNRDEVQKKLAAAGVYAPVLWPIADEARKLCPVASRMADRMLAIPIDQRYNYEDIEEIASIVLKNI